MVIGDDFLKDPRERSYSFLFSAEMLWIAFLLLGTGICNGRVAGPASNQAFYYPQPMETLGELPTVGPMEQRSVQ